MKLYLMNAENIYFPQIKEYYREIVSSYDNGNYRSAMVMLYSTIVCDLLLKLKELSDVYNDKKAEKILKDINEERKKKGNSAWEWDLIETVRERTELLSDESYAMIEHIYDLRNFSAHPAMNDDYELISPSPEMTVAYIKKALEDILVKPSVFADSIVHRMSDDISSKKERYRADIEAFEHYLNKVYFQRMSTKMVQKVFKAFWKFTFIKTAEDGEIYQKDRFINRKTLEAMLGKYYYELCEYIGQNKSYFTISEEPNCMAHACVLLAYYPQIYGKLDETVHHQLSSFKEKDIEVIKWFESGDLEKHLSELKIRKDRIEPKILEILEEICKRQGVGVGFLHCFGCLVDFEIGFCVALFVAPREKTFQRACVTVDRTVGQPFLSHLKNHVVEGCRIEAIDGEGHIQSFRNCVKMLFVSCYGFVFNSSRCDC